MIYTSYLRYILEKRFEYLQFIVDHTPLLLTDELKMQYESIVWVENTSKSSEVCQTTLPRPIIDEYLSAVARHNELANQGNNWRPYSMSIRSFNEGANPDLMLVSILNACGISVPEDNFIGVILKNIPNVVHVNQDHVYKIRKGTELYFEMNMPSIVNVTTYHVKSHGVVLTSPCIVSFYMSDKPDALIDQGMLVDDSTVTERVTAILESIMLYVDFFKRQYNGGEIERTHFSMIIIPKSYGLDGEPSPDTESHAVVVDIVDGNVFVFDGNEGKSYPLHVWYALFDEQYIEILKITVAMIPVTDQSNLRMI